MSTRRALCVGIDKYQNSRYNLNGCVMDAAVMGGVLQDHYNFERDNVRLLVNERATRQGILDRLGWLVDGLEPNDVAVFFYAGHGSQVRDRNNDELEDHLDEILCPHDLNWDNPLTDDILHSYFKQVPDNVNLTCIFDCCNSGTATRGFTLNELMSREKGTSDYQQTRYIDPPLDIKHRSRGLGWWGTDHHKRIGVSIIEENHTLITACSSYQEAQEKRFGNNVRGAFSWHFVKALKNSNWAISYKDAHRDAVQSLKDDGFPQNPQLETSEYMLDIPIFDMLPF